MGPNEGLSDAEYEVAIEHAAKMALIFRFGPNAEEVASFPRWKRWLHDSLPRRHRWRLSWAATPIRDFNRRIGCGS